MQFKFFDFFPHTLYERTVLRIRYMMYILIYFAFSKVLNRPKSKSLSNLERVLRRIESAYALKSTLTDPIWQNWQSMNAINLRKIDHR